MKIDDKIVVIQINPPIPNPPTWAAYIDGMEECGCWTGYTREQARLRAQEWLDDFNEKEDS